jgi:hypothetical protein
MGAMGAMGAMGDFFSTFAIFGIALLKITGNFYRAQCLAIQNTENIDLARLFL